MKLDALCTQIYTVAINEARLQAHEYVTPEHFVYSLLMFGEGRDIVEAAGGDPAKVREDLQRFFDERLEKARAASPAPSESFGFAEMFKFAAMQAQSAEKAEIGAGDILTAVFALKDSVAAYSLRRNGVEKAAMLRYITRGGDDGALAVKEAAAAQRATREANETVANFAVNLTERARLGNLDPVVGRDNILEAAVLSLCRRVKNNPVFVGDAGVGKTALAEGLAQKIADGDVPERLKGASVFEIDMSAVVAGTRYRGDFEERLIKILQAVAKVHKPIIYFDEIHNIAGAGAVGGGAMDAAGILKPYLANGEVRFIGSTTYDEYKKYFEKDTALARRFQKIDVTEPSVAECAAMLDAVREKYENFHNVRYDEAAVLKCAELAAKYINDRKLPDKAIDVLDETAAFVRVNATVRDRVGVTVKDVERVVSKMAGVPVADVAGDERKTLAELEGRLNSAVFGQAGAVKAVADAVKTGRAGLKREDKPVASLLFVGPTGVGKTELAKQLAKLLNVKLLRFDMSEYQERHSVSRLIGSPPGYVGYEQGGQLTDEVRKNPYSVLLLDEIEKAHPDVLNALLQITDYGTLTDNAGRKADFRNVVIIMTSNAGAKETAKKPIGFDDGGRYNPAVLTKEVERVFAPEFRNRLDEIAYFNPVDADMARLIAVKALNEVVGLLGAKGTELVFDDGVIDYIAEKGLSPVYGAREIARVVDREVKKLLTERIIGGGADKETIALKMVDGGVAAE